MSDALKIYTGADDMAEGLFGQVFMCTLEILPYLDSIGSRPSWAIRSKLYGQPANDFIVIPGLLEVNYQPTSGSGREINLRDLRKLEYAAMGSDWEYISGIWNKFFRVPDWISRQADEFPPLDRALGLHYRGTDKNRATIETNFVSAEDFLMLVRDFVATHPDIDLILIATDENAFVERVKAQHPGLRVVNSGKVTHHKDLAGQDGFIKGGHALLDCVLLSRCKYLLKCQSALSGFAKLFNPRLEAYRLAASKLVYWNFGTPHVPDGYLPKLTSRDPACQQILTRLFAGDWTENKLAVKRYGTPFKYRKRKGYMRRASAENFCRIPLWSWDGIYSRLDRRIDLLRNWIGV